MKRFVALALPLLFYVASAHGTTTYTQYTCPASVTISAQGGFQTSTGVSSVVTNDTSTSTTNTTCTTTTANAITAYLVSPPQALKYTSKASKNLLSYFAIGNCSTLTKEASQVTNISTEIGDVGTTVGSCNYEVETTGLKALPFKTVQYQFKCSQCKMSQPANPKTAPYIMCAAS